MPVSFNETVGEMLQEGDGLSFFDPVTRTDTRLATNAVSDFISLDHSPSFEQITPWEVKFAPSSIPESVLFLYKQTGAGEEQFGRPSATAFVLSVPEPKHRALVRFLVTARHVVDPSWANCSEPNPASIQVRLNRRNGGVAYETIPLIDEQGRPRYLTPSDAAADVAAIRLDDQLIPNLDTYKFVDVPSRLLPTGPELGLLASRHTDESRGLPGQTVTTANLRTQVPANLNAFPITQSGVLSTTENEPVDIRCGGNQSTRPLRVWFIDASIEQGVSGAPVYTVLVRAGERSASTVLLGVQAIAWTNHGVASFTPASALTELIQTAIVNQRFKWSAKDDERTTPGRGSVP